MPVHLFNFFLPKNNFMTVEHVHWAEQLAHRIVEEKKEPFVIASGITTSGPTHLGTLCEFLFPGAVYDFLSREHDTRFVFIADIMDAFDSVPKSMEIHSKELSPHLGKPLAHVPDPEGCHSSLGKHFLADVKHAMDEFDSHPEILKATDLYAQGKFDSYARFFFKNFERTRDILFVTSLKREMPEDWSPVMPVCGGCGKIATTVVTKFDEDGYEYECSRNVGYTKGCGFKGKNKIADHKYKITWRLDWPSRQDFLQVSAEGGGVDHFTKGGSWDTAKAVHEQLFGKPGPIGFKFGFILFKGKKYSKSKGAGMGVSDLLKLVPPELLKYALLRPDIQENIDFNPSSFNLLRLFEEFSEASLINVGSKVSRADRKKAIAFSLSTRKMRWRASFADVLLYYQLYRDWDKVGELLKDLEGVKFLKPFAGEWLESGFVPEEYSFEFSPRKPSQNEAAVLEFAGRLKTEMDAVQVHNLVFEVAKDDGLKPGELFSSLYDALIGKSRGPKIGRLVVAVGVEKVKRALEKTGGASE